MIGKKIISTTLLNEEQLKNKLMFIMANTNDTNLVGWNK